MLTSDWWTGLLPEPGHLGLHPPRALPQAGHGQVQVSAEVVSRIIESIARYVLSTIFVVLSIENKFQEITEVPRRLCGCPGLQAEGEDPCDRQRRQVQDTVTIDYLDNALYIYLI